MSLSLYVFVIVSKKIFKKLVKMKSKRKKNIYKVNKQDFQFKVTEIYPSSIIKLEKINETVGSLSQVFTLFKVDKTLFELEV